MEINVTTLFVLMINDFVKINTDEFKNENMSCKPLVDV